MSLDQALQAAKNAKQNLETGTAALYRPDGSKYYSDAEHNERIGLGRMKSANMRRNNSTYAYWAYLTSRMAQVRTRLAR